MVDAHTERSSTGQQQLKGAAGGRNKSRRTAPNTLNGNRTLPSADRVSVLYPLLHLAYKTPIDTGYVHGVLLPRGDIVEVPEVAAVHLAYQANI